MGGTLPDADAAHCWLQGDISRAEAAVQGATSTISGLTVGVDALSPLMQRARRQLEVEKVSEALSRTVAAAKGVGDLPRLEAAILQARKLAAADLQPGTVRWGLRVMHQILIGLPFCHCSNYGSSLQADHSKLHHALQHMAYGSEVVHDSASPG